MEKYIIAGEATFTASNRQNQARTRMQAVLDSYTYTEVASIFPAGITQPSNSQVQVSFQIETDNPELPKTFRRDLYTAWVGAGGVERHTIGWLGVSLVP